MVKTFLRSARWRWRKTLVSNVSAMARNFRVWRRLVPFFNAHRICSIRQQVAAVKNAPKISPTHRQKVQSRAKSPKHSVFITLIHFPGGCLMMGDFFPSAKDKKVKPDVCSTCTCHNETSVCLKKTCPVLECSPEHQLNRPGECCPSCPPLITELVSSTCTFKSVTYQVGGRKLLFDERMTAF